MSKTTMLHEISPDELIEKILNGVEMKMEQFKKEIVAVEKTEFMTIEETAKFFKISNFTIHDWVKKSLLKKYKFGNRTYFDRKEIENKMYNSNKS
jgi:hypothetical protein